MINLFFSYREGDFDLSDDIEIENVSTMIANDVGKSTKAIENVLITFWENAKISYSEKSTIYYERMNHLNFEYQIHVKNPKGVSKKVLVRLWLGSLEDENDIRLYYYFVYKVVSCFISQLPPNQTHD